KRSWSSSVAPSRLTSGVVVTSMPRWRSPAAMAREQFSSRWNRIVRGIDLPCLKLLEDGRGAGPELLGKLLAVADLPVDLIAVVTVIGQGRVNVREGDGRILGHDLVRAHPHPLMPDGDVRNRDPMTSDARLSTAHPWCCHDAISQAPAFHRGSCSLT